MFRKVIFSIVLAVAATASFAIPRPSDVKAAFASGNYSQAESMLQEVMKERPTAAVHYQLGQIYAAQGKHNQALNEYRQAQTLDPTLKFASSAAVFMKGLSNEQTIVAPPVATIAQAAPMITYSNVREVAQPLSRPHDNGMSGFAIFMIVLVVMGAGIGIYMMVSKKSTSKATADAETADSKEKTTRLMEMSKQLEDSILIAKTASYDEDMRRKILERITALQTNVRSALADIRDRKGYSSSRLVTLETQVNTTVDQAANGIPAGTVNPAVPPVFNLEDLPVAPTQTREEMVRPYMSTAPWPNGTGPRIESVPPTTSAWRDAPKPMFTTPAPTVVHHYHETRVQNNSNDLLTGVLIGEALSGHHDRVVEVERPVYRAPALDTSRNDSYEERVPTREVYSAPAVLDTSDDDRHDSYSSSDNSSSSDDSSSSFDSGSSSSDSY